MHDLQIQGDTLLPHQHEGAKIAAAAKVAQSRAGGNPTKVLARVKRVVEDGIT
jgi:hypothetical protein